MEKIKGLKVFIKDLSIKKKECTLDKDIIEKEYNWLIQQMEDFTSWGTGEEGEDWEGISRMVL